MHTRTRRNYCFAIVLGADKKNVLLITLFVRGYDSTFSCYFVICATFSGKSVG